MNAFSLQGKRALVTGANTGIGQAIAIAMGAAGAEVLCAARRDCDDTLSKIDKGRHVAVDFADPMAAAPLFENEAIDILVNNAGIIRRADSVAFTGA
ncbi:MAG: SDR family NAD(P)-dependent oxidoreductase, partial [Nitratireductor sp.]